MPSGGNRLRLTFCAQKNRLPYVSYDILLYGARTFNVNGAGIALPARDVVQHAH